jgi:hypothetical protein
MMRPHIYVRSYQQLISQTVALYIVQLSVADRYSEQLQHVQLFDTAVYSSVLGHGRDCDIDRNVAGLLEF